MRRVYKWMVRLVNGKLNELKEKRDQKFRDRIDRVYFRKDVNGIRNFEGNFRLNGNFWTTGFLSANAPVKEDEYRALLGYQDTLVDISRKLSNEQIKNSSLHPFEVDMPEFGPSPNQNEKRNLHQGFQEVSPGVFVSKSIGTEK